MSDITPEEERHIIEVSYHLLNEHICASPEDLANNLPVTVDEAKRLIGGHIDAGNLHEDFPLENQPQYGAEDVQTS